MKLLARRFLPQIILAAMLVLALVVISLGLAIDASGSSPTTHPPVVLRYAHETDLAAGSGARARLYAEADQIAMRQAATIPLVNPTKGILPRKGVEGLMIAGGQLLAPDWSRVTISGSAAQ
jgi:hypothetical protein